MTPDPENAEIIQDLLAILPEVREQVSVVDLVYEVAGAFALRLRDPIRAGADSGDERVRRAFALLDDLAGRESRNAQEIAAFGIMEVVMDFPETDSGTAPEPEQPWGEPEERRVRRAERPPWNAPQSRPVVQKSIRTISPPVPTSQPVCSVGKSSPQNPVSPGKAVQVRPSSPDQALPFAPVATTRVDPP